MVRPANRRRSIRLPEYDYASPGAYFVTVVCKDRQPLLANERFREICESAWLWLGHRHDHVELDEYVIMPNHLHGLLVMGDTGRGGSRTAPTEPTQPRKPLGRLIGAFKTISTKRINEIRGTPGAPVWQRNYYERVVRDERELSAIRTYIAENPLRWAEDPENPAIAAVQATGEHRGSPLRTDRGPS